MAEVWIQEEKITGEFLDDIGHYIGLNGNINSVYFIAGDTGEDAEDRKR